MILESAAEPGGSVFRLLRFYQAECSPLLVIQAHCGRFDDFRVEERGPECQPFAERLDDRLCHRQAAEPFVFCRDDVPGCRRRLGLREHVVEGCEVVAPACPVADVLRSDLPMLGRRGDPLVKPPQLLLVGDVQE